MCACVYVWVCKTAECWAAELKAWELTGCMPGPPSQLHHPALLFSWVAGLITDPRWHTITHARAHTQLFLTFFFFFYPSLALALFFLLHFSCHIVIFSPLTLLFLTFSFTAFFFCPLFFFHSVTLFSCTQHILPFFFCFCHPFFYFLCFFLFLTYCFLLSLFTLSYSVRCLPFSNSSFLTSPLLLSLAYFLLYLWLKVQAQEGGTERTRSYIVKQQQDRTVTQKDRQEISYLKQTRNVMGKARGKGCLNDML